MTNHKKKNLFKQLNKIKSIWIDEWDNKFDIQAVYQDADQVRDILNKFDIVYQESEFYSSENGSGGINFAFEL